jgi:predicted metal-dependent hydrolase
MESTDYDPLYLEGIAHFNACDFFEAHESWEELWTDYQGPLRKFYQGLIQAAVALHHFGNGNIRGAKKLYFGSLGYLEPYRPVQQGLNLDKFLGEMTRCFAPVIAAEEAFPQIEVDPETIPEIHLE